MNHKKGPRILDTNTRRIKNYEFEMLENTFHWLKDNIGTRIIDKTGTRIMDKTGTIG